MSETKLIGGSESDRKSVLEQQQAYLDANSKFDWEALRDKIWSDAPEATFFNLNGHTYNGRDHWIELWQYYKQHMATGEWVPYDIGGAIGSDVAVLWCHRKTKLRWIGSDPRPGDKRHEDKDFVSRSTMVFRKQNGGWRVVHVHFSEASSEQRPGGI
jgi:ketosteroid isomerase-like protein